MNTVTQAASSATDPTDPTQLDALVIGAGIAASTSSIGCASRDSK